MDVVLGLLRQCANDAASRDRIALASTFSHGESTWVFETAWQASLAGRVVKREATSGGVTRVDLEVDGIAVEFKSTMGVWSLIPDNGAEREKWLGNDVAKLGTSSAPGIVVVTVAALADGTRHQRPAFKAETISRLHHGKDPEEVLEAGIAAATDVLSRTCGRLAQVRLGQGSLPAGGGSVLLGAVVAAANVAAEH